MTQDELIKKCRKHMFDNNIKQQELAKKAVISVNCMSRFMRGKAVSGESLLKIITILEA